VALVTSCPREPDRERRRHVAYRRTPVTRAPTAYYRVDTADQTSTTRPSPSP
jgi:hypothetical protein